MPSSGPLGAARRRLPFLLAAALLAAAPARARPAAEMAGLWTLTFDRTGASCRVILQPSRLQRGDYVFSMPSACRHAMPGVAGVGRWSAPDDDHLVLSDPGGAALLTLAAAGDGFVSAGPVGTYALTPADAGSPAAQPTIPAPAALAPVAPASSVAAPLATPVAAAPAASALPPVKVASRQVKAAESVGDLAGRYAVMRDKRDTGCMVTLDRAHASGGDRAQLAPGCRDQGIVVFDPSAWQVVHGELVLTARAGHKTKLERGEDGVWAKDPKEGGKPLGLKRL